MLRCRIIQKIDKGFGRASAVQIGPATLFLVLTVYILIKVCIGYGMGSKSRGQNRLLFFLYSLAKDGANVFLRMTKSSDSTDKSRISKTGANKNRP